MNLEGHINFEDLKFEYRYSCMPDRLHFYTKEENDFRMKVREWCKKHIEPVVEKIDRERNKKLAVEVLRKMKPYLNSIIGPANKQDEAPKILARA